jgi:hypothetical protein
MMTESLLKVIYYLKQKVCGLRLFDNKKSGLRLFENESADIWVMNKNTNQRPMAAWWQGKYQQRIFLDMTSTNNFSINPDLKACIVQYVCVCVCVELKQIGN